MDIIYALKFVHLVAAAAMFGGWLAIAIFFILAHRSANPSVVALVAQFVVSLELFMVAPAIVLVPLSGFPLAAAIGLSGADDFWMTLSIGLFVVFAVGWLGAVFLERRIRDLTRAAAVSGAPLPDAYPRLFRIWLAIAVPILLAMTAVFLLMVWQPRLD
jgi:uncharacterized membrane protein